MDDQTSNFVLAADTANMQAGGTSFFADLGDAATKGVGAAVVSGLASIYNTGVDVSNYFGNDAERIDVHRVLSDVDQNWGDYYAQHQGVIDVAGFVGTSFIPGGLAVKGLNLLRRGEAAGTFARALNYSTTAQKANLEKALQTIASPEGSVFSRMKPEYLKALSWGVADQVLQTATFEVAVAATMKASPLLDGQSWRDITHDIVKTSVLGGVFGGTIEGIFLNGIVKDAQRTVNLTKNKYNFLEGAGGLGLEDADKAYSFIQAAMNLPKVVEDSDKALAFSYKLNGRVNELPGGLKTGELYDKTLQQSVKKAYTEMESLLTNNLAAEGDVTVGQAFSKGILDILKDGKAQGATNELIQDRLGDFLFNLDKVEGIGDKLPSVAGETLYSFQKGAQIAKGENPFLPFKANEVPPEGQVFRIKGDPGELKVASAGLDARSQTDAWDKGYDLFLKKDGTIAYNPKSSIVRPIQPPSGFQTIFNIATGKTGDTAVATAADVATKDSPLIVTGAGVTTGNRSFNFKVGDQVFPEDAVESTARHLWASKLEKIDGTVDGNDFSVLDRMSAKPSAVADTTEISVNGDVRNWREFGNYVDFLKNRKIDVLQERFEAGITDIQELAYEINATPQWIQEVIANRFDKNLVAKANPQGWQRELSDYGQRENVILNYKRPDRSLYKDVKGAEGFQGPLRTVTGNDGGGFFAEDGSRFITGSQAYQYRVKLAQDNVDTTFASVFGEDAERFFDFNDAGIAKLADGNAAGAGLVSFSNANYGDKLKLFSQETGKQVHLLSQQIANTNLSRLQSFVAEFNNGTAESNKAAAELIALTTKVRRSPEKYVILGADYGLDGSYLVEKSLLRGTDAESLAAIKDSLISRTQDSQRAYHIENQLTADFLATHHSILSDLNEKRQALANARGIPVNRSPDVLYVPPIDTQKVPYFAFVVPQEGRVFADSGVSMITARSAGELKALTAQIPESSGLKVIFKGDTEEYYKAKGLYDYQRTLSDNATDATLKREGKLGDYLPSFDIASTLEDYLNFHQRQAVQLVRDGVSTKYGQAIAELQRQSESYTLAAKSMFGDTTSKQFKRGLKDPYDDLIKGMLDISKRSEFTLLHQTNEMLDALGTRAYRAMEGTFKDLASRRADPIEWEEANNQLQKFGLGAPFTDQMAYDIARTPADRNLLKLGLQKANMILSTAVLRFDWANSLINIISTPIMLGTELSAIKNSIKNNPELAGKLSELTSLAIPGDSARIPSMTKTIFEATQDWWGPNKAELIARFQKNGDINSVPAMYHEMINDLSLVPGLSPKDYASKADQWVEKAAKWSGNNWAEQFTRFVSANTMKKLTDPLVEAGNMSIKEQDAFISVFVNRVQGNYISSQRPILFQGTLGSALGLFQTYQFNMMQQLFRHIEDRNLKSVAVMGALQSSIYGMNGLPLFEAVNTHILGNAAINDGHRDAYSYATQAAGRDLGNWLMYGTASALPLFNGQGPSLYTRGDVNPRHISVIPTNPLDIPAVDGTIRFVQNLINTGQKLMNGGAVVPTLLEGLEHNSLNRPLAGLGQILNGYSTTSKGSLIGTSQDLFSIANAGRILGAKPLDESIGLNTKFRTESYKAEDKANMEELGQAVKTKLRNNQPLSDDDMQTFMGRYAASGGQVQNFGAALQRWSKDANTSVINNLEDKVRSPYGQRLVEVMGGTRLPDYRNQSMSSSSAEEPQ